MAIFLIVLPRVLFKTQLKESPAINVQLCSKIAYVAFKGKKIINLHNFNKCYIILQILQL